ncbi:Inositol polyphosphate 5-phosphatase OCRL-1 [Escovopsis weberi]|uniref:Inositol polyphosphate 5-phosphatase OCRL-1 n=1 Tax=Escovopsis weberi TaxID=150374 RepID=A0A0M9VWW9_ESCWE|nr:Inositol polyphosphate 5-phosphatase OCRL-1 [Escovopsis weberi]
MESASGREQSVHSVGSEPEDLASTPISLARAVLARWSEYVRPSKTRIKIGTWNVASCPGTDKDLARWFVDGEGLDQRISRLRLSQSLAADGDAGPLRPQGGEDIGLYVLGLQEVVDLNPTREYMNLASYTDAGPINRWKAALEAAMPAGFQLVVSEQMTGLLLLIYASPEVAPIISNISTHQIGTGLWGYFGNKGAVVTRLVLGETTRLVFVNCHFASGASPSYLERRCWDVGQVMSRTQFEPIVSAGVAEDAGSKIGDEDFAFWFGDLNFRLDGLPGEDIRRLLTLHARGEYDLKDTKPAPPIEGGDGIIVMKGSESDDDTTTLSSMHSRGESFDSVTSLPDPDGFPEDPSQDPASLQSAIDSLLPHDQLRRIIAQQKFFHDGWKEGQISFLPTYKYDVGTVGLFDSSEKQRAPSWCDRILYRSRKDKEAYDKKIQEQQDAKKRDEEMRSRGIEEDDDVLFSYDPDIDGEEQPKAADLGYDEYDDIEVADTEVGHLTEEASDGISLEFYTSHQEIMSSDHKPVTSVFTLNYLAVDPEKRAIVHAEVARDYDRAENEGRPGVTLVVEGGKGGVDGAIDFGSIGFFERHVCSITVANTGGVAASLEFLPKLTTGSDEHGDGPGGGSWLKTNFLRSEEEDKNETLGPSVVLEPGETVSAVIEAQVTSTSQLHKLNDASSKLEDVLILHVEGGRDHFIPVFGTWVPSCFGRSIDELIRVPEGGVRKFVEEKDIKGAIPYDWPVHCSAPRELFKLTEAIQTLAERCVADEAMLENMMIPGDPGWPFDVSTHPHGDAGRTETLKAAVVRALDLDTALADALPVELASARKLEIMSSVLLLFLASLTDGLVPAFLWAKLGVVLPNLASIPAAAWPDAKNQVLDVLSASPSHNIAFVFLAATLARVAGELAPLTQEAARPLLSRRISFRPGAAEDEAVRKRRARERRYAELVGPLSFRSGANEKERAARERERILTEMFLRRDEEEG